jgi:hypothetical protein
MPTLLQELPEPVSYDANTSWLLIEHASTLYKIKSSVFLDTLSIQSDYLDSQYQELSFQNSSVSFSCDYLLSTASSFVATFEFGEKAKFPTATIIKNGGENVCRLMTFEGLSEIAIGASSGDVNLSTYATQDDRQTNIVGNVSLVQGLTDSISLSSLRLQNVSDLSSIDSAYCCAKIKAQAYNA